VVLHGVQVVSLFIVPLALDEANAFVARLHRHNGELPGCKHAIGVQDSDGVLRGVAIIGNPSAPALQKVPRLIEIRRVCTDGERNACSKLYGAARRGLREFGWETIITYTLPSEGGASLRAAGFTLDKTDAGGPAKFWKNRPGRTVLPIEDDLVGGKWRWVA
jgi:hypothetical protein